MAVPVSLDDARTQLRLTADETDSDAEIVGFIADAAGWVERYTGHILVARTVTETFAAFDRLRLRAWPIKPGAALTVTYADATGCQVSVTGSRLALDRRPGSLLPAIGARWPTLPCGSAITVTVRAGYEDADAVPGNFRRAMLLLIGAYDADREGGEILKSAEATARSLCRDYRERSL